MFLGGKVTYVVEGVTYFLQPWDLLLVRHHAIHRPTIDPAEPYERVVVWLGREWLERRGDPGEPLETCFQLARERGFHLLRFDGERRLDYMRTIQRLEEATRSREFGAARLADTLCQQLLIAVDRDILRSRTAQEEKDSYRVDPKIEEILHYIAAHLEEELTVDALAGRFLPEPVLSDAPLQGGHGLYAPPVYQPEAAGVGRGADPERHAGDEGGGAGGLFRVLHLPAGLPRHLSHESPGIPVSKYKEEKTTQWIRKAINCGWNLPRRICAD